MTKAGVFSALILANTACGGGTPLPLSKKIEADFGAAIEQYGIQSCRAKGGVVKLGGVFYGTFYPPDDHKSAFFSLDKLGNYEIIPSNILLREFAKSNDGKGGPSFSDAYNNPLRDNIEGVIFKGNLVCGGHSLKDDASSGLIFAYSYGKSVK